MKRFNIASWMYKKLDIVDPEYLQTKKIMKNGGDLSILAVTENCRWIIQILTTAIYLEDFYNSKLSKYVRSNNIDDSDKLLGNVIYNVCGIKANSKGGSLELSRDFCKHTDLVLTEQKIIELFLNFCTKNSNPIKTYFCEIGIKFPYKANSDLIKGDKCKIIYLNCNPEFKETQDFQNFKKILGKPYSADFKESLQKDLGERIGYKVDSVINKLVDEKTHGLA